MSITIPTVLFWILSVATVVAAIVRLRVTAAGILIAASASLSLLTSIVLRIVMSMIEGEAMIGAMWATNVAHMFFGLLFAVGLALIPDALTSDR